MSVNITTVNADLSAVSAALPLLMAAYQAYKAIWTAVNPGVDEASFLTHLEDLASRNISAADAILMADGYVRGTDGSWAKPAAA